MKTIAKWFGRALLFIGAVLLVGCSSAGQSTIREGQHRWTITLDEGTVISCDDLRPEPQELFVASTQTRNDTITAATVAKVREIRPSQAPKGAILGAIGGGLVGGLFVLAAPQGHAIGIIRRAVAAAFATVGFVVGGALGAAIGSAQPRERVLDLGRIPREYRSAVIRRWL